MAAIQINRTVDLSKMVQPEALTGVTFTEESGGHEFVLTAKDAVLSGTVKARFMRGDGSTTEFFGSTVDGVAHLTLTDDCYEVAGRFLLTVFYDGGDGIAVIYAAVGHVVKSSNGAVTPSQPAAQSFEDILAGYVQQMTSATNAANAAAGNANTAAEAAQEAAEAAAEAAATKAVRYDTAQTLTDAQKTQARANVDGASVGDVNDLKSALSVNSRNILPKQPAPGVITVIDLGEEKTFPNGVNISFDLLAFTGNGTAGVITLRNTSDAVVATVTLNGMRNVDTGIFYSAESSPHSGRYSSYAITALQSSLTFRYVRVRLDAIVVTSGSINNFMLTDGHYPSPYVPTFEAKDYDLETLTNPIEVNTAVNAISLMDSSFWAAKADYYRLANGGMVQLSGAFASRLFPCKAGDTLSYKLYMGNGTKVLFTFDQNMQIVNTVDALGTAVAVSGIHTFTATERYFAFNCMISQLSRMYVKYNDIPVAIKGYVKEYVENYAVLSRTFPEYWDTAVGNAVTAIKNQLLAMDTGDCFFFVTDQHWTSNAQHSSPIIDYISKKTGIYNVFIGGDVVMSNNASQVGAMTEMLDYLESFKGKNVRLFSTLGNHDRNSVAQSDQTLWLSLAQQYNALIKPEEEWLDTDGTPLCNVYDNKSQKVRYIQFWYTADSGYNADVASALVSAMTSTPDDYTIILMSHAYWNGTDPAQGAVTFANLILDTMDTMTATVALWVCGHVHADKTVVLTSTGGKSLRIMSTTTDSVGQHPSSPSMTAGTTTEQAFDVYCINTTAKTINAVRVGAGESRSFTY